MYLLAGETGSGRVHLRCPGEGCQIWDASAGDHDYKIESQVCAGCLDCGGTPPLKEQDDEPDEEEALDMLDDIESIVSWEQAGLETDWSHYPFEYCRLVRVWRDTQREVEAIQQASIQSLIKGFQKQK